MSGLSTVYQVIEKITEVAEAGGGGGGMVINGTITESNITMDKTAGEVYQALTNGIVPLLVLEVGVTAFLPLVSASLASGTYTYNYIYESTGLSFIANSADDYPVATVG